MTVYIVKLRKPILRLRADNPVEAASMAFEKWFGVGNPSDDDLADALVVTSLGDERQWTKRERRNLEESLRY